MTFYTIYATIKEDSSNHVGLTRSLENCHERRDVYSEVDHYQEAVRAEGVVAGADSSGIREQRGLRVSCRGGSLLCHYRMLQHMGSVYPHRRRERRPHDDREINSFIKTKSPSPGSF